MATQINIRLDDQAVAALDELAAGEGSTRAEIVRAAVLRLLRAAEHASVASAYRQAYEAQPETVGELRRAQRSAGRITGEESWERWW
ncbi:MAG: ribbon-helix-helix domain-containing protein [Acidimicrobiia bacterium]